MYSVRGEVLFLRLNQWGKNEKNYTAQGGVRTLDLEIMRLARHRLRHLGFLFASAIKSKQILSMSKSSIHSVRTNFQSLTNPSKSGHEMESKVNFMQIHSSRPVPYRRAVQSISVDRLDKISSQVDSSF